MEFAVGTHVVIELMDERKIAGYLIGGSLEEGGLFLKATHKDLELEREVTASVSEKIRGALEVSAGWRLRLAAVLSGNPVVAFAERGVLIDVLYDQIVDDMLEAAEDGMRFRELVTPVTTFVNSGAILLMENTADRVIEAEVSLFDQTEGKSEDLDRVLNDILNPVKDLNDGETEADG